jgi:hypothetical protein
MNNSKFCIYIPDEPTGKRVKDIADKAGISLGSLNPLNFIKHWLRFENLHFMAHANFKYNLPEITLSEFESLFSTKEIIGYKCPMDLFGGLVRAGTVYNFEEHTKDLYYPTTWRGSKGLPKEIVETWEPVFKKEEEKVVICGGDEIKLSEKCYTTKAGQQFYIEDIEGPLTELMHFFSQETKLAEIHNLLKPSI